MKIENVIKYTNLDLLTKEEQDIIKKIFEGKYEKIQRLLKNEFNLVVTIKVKEKLGARKQYFFYLKTESPSKELAITPRETDLERLGYWDAARAAHKAINHLVSLIQNRFRNNTWKDTSFKKAMQKAGF